jgi:predicted ATPase
VRNFPLLVVLTHRPEFQSRWGVHGHVTGLNLSKLTRAQSSAMVSELAGSKSLPADLVQQILAKTDGVPLFVEELTKSILESSELKEAGDHYEYAGSRRSIAIPATLRDSLMARLDRYIPVKEIAQIGAALGREFSYELIAAVAPREKAELEESLEGLTASGLAFRRGTPPDATYTFKHALVQEAAYDSLLKSRRQELHRKIARILSDEFKNVAESQPELLAYHLTQAGVFEEAIGYWQRAGQQATEQTANIEAIAHFSRGLELVQLLPEGLTRDQLELNLRVGFGVPLSASLGYSSPEVEKTYTRARELSEQVGGSPQFANIVWGLWVRYLTGGPIGAALEIAEQYRAIAERSQESGLLLEMCQVMGIALFYLGEFQQALPYLARGSVMYEPERHHALIYEHGGADTGVAIRTHEALALWTLGYPDQAGQRMQNALDTAKSLTRHPFSVAFAHYFDAWLYKLYRDDKIVEQATDLAIKICREQRFPFWELASVSLRGSALVERGAAAEGISAMRQALASYSEIGGNLYGPELHGLLSLGFARGGQIEEAQQTIAEALRMVEQSHDRWWHAELHRLNGELMLVLPGDHAAEAEAAFQEAIAIARAQQAKSWELRAATSLASLWHRQGKIDAARQLLGDVYAWFTEGHDTADLLDAAALLAELKG